MFSRSVSFVMILLVGIFLAPVAYADTPSVQTAWRLLDYLAVDYHGAVQGGKVISTSEFAEMTEFSASAHERIDALPASDAKAGLQQRAGALQTLIANKASAEAVATTARQLAADLIKAYPVPLAPVQAPDFVRGQALFAQNCASCHGLKGDGKGPAAAGLDPPPIAFADKDRARQRSVFALYQVLEQGIDGTSMASFAALPPQDRWNLALYASAFSYPAGSAVEGERIWKADRALRARMTLQKLVGMTPATLATEIGAAKADAVTAYLRRNPSAVAQKPTGSLTLARTRLDEAVATYAKGDRKEATNLALAAYLDGVEPVEPILSARDKDLIARIEGAMGALRAGIARGAPLDEVRSQAGALDVLFNDAEAALAPSQASTGSSFFGAFTILMREGLEALLIVVAMLAFLRKADRGDVMPYVHGGWITALAAGGLTWAVATYFIGISGASRELTEGFGSVFAAIVLLWVGVWMHGKSNADAWQRYIREKLTHALNARSAWFLFGLSFVVVYREVFETILFLAAIGNQGNGNAVVAGCATAAVTLFGVAWAMMRYSRSLPIGKFFAYSSALIAVLAVVLIGKGVSALQEAGYLAIYPLAGVPQIELLGLFPTTEGVLAQIVMIVLLAIGFSYNSRVARSGKPAVV